MERETMVPARASWGDSEVAAVRDLARTFFEKEVVPHQEKFVAQGHPDRDLYRRAGELGLLCAAVPEEYGGGGGTFAHEAAIIEEQCYAVDASMGMPVHSALVAPYLVHFGSDDLRQRLLPKVASGYCVLSTAITEPDAGSDLQNIKNRAVRASDEEVLTRSKIFI